MSTNIWGKIIMLRLYHCCGFAVFFVFWGISVGNELPPETRKKAESVFRGMDDTIMRINSGVCHVIGKTTQPGGTIIDDDILIAFDYGKRLYRFDNAKRARTLLTQEFYYEVWNPLSPDASVERSLASEPKISHFPNFFDVQAIFFFVPVGIKKHFEYQSEIHQKMSQFKLVSLQNNPNGLIVLGAEFPNPDGYPPLVANYFIASDKDFTVQRIEYNCGYTMDISWKQINDTWVPTAFSQHAREGFGVDWKIDWEIVNDHVPPEYFDIEKIVSDHSSIPLVSRELGEPILLENVGFDAPIKPSETDRHSGTRYFLITLGLLMIVISLIKMYYDRRKRKSA